MIGKEVKKAGLSKGRDWMVMQLQGKPQRIIGGILELGWPLRTVSI